MGGLFPPNVPLFRSNLVNKIKYFNEDRQIEYVADLDFWLRLFMDNNEYSYVNLPLAYYRKSKSSMSSDLFEMNKQLDLCLERIMASNPSRCFQSFKRIRYENKNLRSVSQFLNKQKYKLDLSYRKRYMLLKELKNRDYKNIFIWGTGKAGHFALSEFKLFDIDISGFIDNDYKKNNKYLDSYLIVDGVTFLKEYKDNKDTAIVICSMYSDAIRDQIISYNFNSLSILNYK